MNNPKVKYGDIYSANHTGHEVVICSLSEGDNKNLFYRVERDGYDFTVRLIEHLPKDMDSTKRKEAIKVHSAAANGRWCGDQRPPCGLKTAG